MNGPAFGAEIAQALGMDRNNINHRLLGMLDSGDVSRNHEGYALTSVPVVTGAVTTGDAGDCGDAGDATHLTLQVTDGDDGDACERERAWEPTDRPKMRVIK